MDSRGTASHQASKIPRYGTTDSDKNSARKHRSNATSTESERSQTVEARPQQQFAVDITSRRQLNELQRLEQTHGNKVHEWLAEGMPREAMGTPSEMHAFRMAKNGQSAQQKPQNAGSKMDLDYASKGTGSAIQLQRMPSQISTTTSEITDSSTDTDEAPNTTETVDELLAEMMTATLNLDRATISPIEKEQQKQELNENNADKIRIADENWYARARQAAATRRSVEGVAAEDFPWSRNALKDEETQLTATQRPSLLDNLPFSHPASQARLTLVRKQLSFMYNNNDQILQELYTLNEGLQKHIELDTQEISRQSLYRTVRALGTDQKSMPRLRARLRKHEDKRQRETRKTRLADTIERGESYGDILDRFADPEDYRALEHVNLNLEDDLEFQTKQLETLRDETGPYHQIQAREQRIQTYQNAIAWLYESDPETADELVAGANNSIQQLREEIWSLYRML